MTAALLLLALALIAANGFFVGAEFAVSRPAAPGSNRGCAARAGLGPHCAPSSSCP